MALFRLGDRSPILINSEYNEAKKTAKRNHGRIIPTIGYPFVGSDSISFIDHKEGIDRDGVPITRREYVQITGKHKLSTPRTRRLLDYSPRFIEKDSLIEDARENSLYIPANSWPFAGALNRRILNYVIIPKPYGAMSGYEYRFDVPVDDMSVESRFMFVFDLYWPDPANTEDLDDDLQRIEDWMMQSSVKVNHFSAKSHSYIVFDVDDEHISDCYGLIQ